MAQHVACVEATKNAAFHREQGLPRSTPIQVGASRIGMAPPFCRGCSQSHGDIRWLGGVGFDDAHAYLRDVLAPGWAALARGVGTGFGTLRQRFPHLGLVEGHNL